MKRFSFFIVLISACIGWMVLSAPSNVQPSREEPLHFYSNQTRHDLHKIFSTAIQSATRSIHLTMYALTDSHLIRLLAQKAEAGVKTQIFYDPSATSPLPERLPATTVALRGALMHRKILVIDQEKVFLGSANFTESSLKMHDNLVAGLYHPELAKFLTQGGNPSFTCENRTLWLLPSQAALESLLQRVSSAQKKIRVAMFTLTHPLLTTALIEAHRRGVDVRIAVDHYTAEGASAKMLEKFREEGVPLFLSQGGQLFHHKWAMIDGTLILGSANWTRAAFSKNHDCFMVFDKLSKAEKKQLRSLWKIIELDAEILVK